MAAGNSAAMPQTRMDARAMIADIAIVAAVEILGALFLRTFILSDSSVVVALLVLMSAGFVALQIWPSLEERIVAAFTRTRLVAVLLGLALIGGGVATTAGGVKLLRVYVLYLAGLRELQLLAYPSSVAGRSQHNPRIRRSGIFITWLTFMLFALTLALLTVVLAAMGIGFDQAVVLAVATLSTTGPLIEVAGETPLRLIELGPAAKAVLCAAMVLGRLEMLAIIALFAPSLWRQ